MIKINYLELEVGHKVYCKIGNKTVWGKGPNIREAIGDMIWSNCEFFGFEQLDLAPPMPKVSPLSFAEFETND